MENKRKKIIISIIILLLLLVLVAIFFFRKKDENFLELELIGDKVVTLTVGANYQDAGAKAYDTKDGHLTNEIIIENTVNPDVPGTYKIIYSVENSSGQRETIERIIKVVAKVENDITKPEITILGNNPEIIFSNTDYQDAGATAFDEEDGDLTDKIITMGSVDTTKTGTYYITYSVSDNAGNETKAKREVKVVKRKSIKKDTTKPKITILGSNPININRGSYYYDAGATAHDNIDGNITNKIITNGYVNTNKTGTYYITYKVSDRAGNTSTARRTVNVVSIDIQAPKITILGDNPLVIYNQEKYIEAGATAYDNVDGDLTSKIKTTGKVDNKEVGKYYITYTVSDKAGNVAKATREVIVFDLIGYNEPIKPIEPKNCIGIYNADDLNNVRNNLTGTYCLKNNIDMSTYQEWTPIGDEDNKFSGTIIGNNHYIMNVNLEIEIPEDSEEIETLSLFGMVENSEFHNINFKNIDMTAPKDVALLASNMDGTIKITNSRIEPSVNLVTTDKGNIGGFAVIANGDLTLHNNYVEFEVKNANTAGMFIAIVQQNTEKLDLVHSTAKSDVENNSFYGGFVGLIQAKNVNLNNSIASGTGTSGIFGGFIGQSPTNDNLIIKDLIVYDIDVNANGNAGGVIGVGQPKNLIMEDIVGKDIEITGGTIGGLIGLGNAGSNLIINNVDLTGNLTGNTNPYSYAGGIIGGSYRAQNNDISNIVFKGNVTSTNTAGGVAGQINNNTNLENIEVVGNITSENHYASGIIGTSYGADLVKISDVSYHGNVISNYKYGVVGGVAGQINANMELENINISGDIKGNDVGGLIGSAYQGSYINISKVTQEGNIISTNHAGGLIGTTNLDTIINNVNISGSIETTSDYGATGGLIGDSHGIKATDIQIVSNITGGRYNGGVAGIVYEDLELLNVSVTADVIGTEYDDSTSGGICGQISLNREIKLENIDITGDVYGKSKAGGLFGQYFSFLTGEHIRIEGNILSDGEYGAAGGFAGHANHSKDDVINDVEIIGDIEGARYAGGFYGELYANTTITNSKYEGNIQSLEEGEFNGGRAGGIIGLASGKTYNIADVDVLGNITGYKEAGGIFGAVYINEETISSLTNITYKGDIKAIGEVDGAGSERVAGSAGGVAGLTLCAINTENITIESNIDGYSYAGGIFGYAIYEINPVNITFIGTTTSLNGITSDTIAGKGEYWD